MGTFISLLPFPEIKGQEDRGSWWPLRSGCVSSPVGGQRGDRMSAPRGRKHRARRRSGSRALQPGVQPGVSGQEATAWSVQRAPSPFLSWGCRKLCPGRSSQGGEGTHGHRRPARSRKGNCETPRGPNAERRDLLSQHYKIASRKG